MKIPLQLTVNVDPGRIISDLMEWFDMNLCFDPKHFVKSDIDKLKEMANRIEEAYSTHWAF